MGHVLRTLHGSNQKCLYMEDGNTGMGAELSVLGAWHNDFAWLHTVQLSLPPTQSRAYFSVCVPFTWHFRSSR